MKTINKQKRQTTEWEKVFVNDAANETLISKINKQLIQLNKRKKQKPNLKKVEDLNRYLSKEENKGLTGT